MYKYLGTEIMAMIANIMLFVACMYAAQKFLSFAFKKTKDIFILGKTLLRMFSVIFALMLCVLSLINLRLVPSYIPNIVRLIQLSDSRDPRNFVALGGYFLTGKYMRKDYKEARRCFKKAARHNEPQAFFMLAGIYFMGWGVEINPEKATKYMFKAANYNLPGAQACLGKMYLEGKFLEQSTEKAEYFLKLAANQGHKSAINFLQNLPK